MALEVVEAPLTRVELEEAMAHLVATLRRMPAHWTDRRAGLHNQIDELLETWEHLA